MAHHDEPRNLKKELLPLGAFLALLVAALVLIYGSAIYRAVQPKPAPAPVETTTAPAAAKP